jgi:hypothetical protein
MASKLQSICKTGNNRPTRRGAHIGGLLGSLAMLGAAGCINRPVSETNPETYNVFLNRVQLANVDKIDLLFMVDNSLSMADKQQVLAAAVPQLLRRLTSPDCVDSANTSTAPIAMRDPTSTCDRAGYEREFSPVKDIHIGIVTSSLGDFGGDSCSAKREKDGSLTPGMEFTLAKEDDGWLLGGLERTQGKLDSPFLTWSPEDAKDFVNRIEDKETEFRNFVTAAGEDGCGFEMTLESWYRFLIDPVPPERYETVGNWTARKGEDSALLAQRKQFLRPDSLLAIVMLTDENDCSVRDDGAAFLLMSDANFPRASSACEKDPNDPCCYNCAFTEPAGCTADPVCKKPPPRDMNNLRCFDQKRRYGRDFLFPIRRYVNALRLPEICPDQTYGTLDCECKDEKGKPLDGCSAGTHYKNPIFDPTYSGAKFGTVARTGPDMVFLAGIVGVPWQDIAEAGTEQKSADLRYKLSSKIDWDLILPSTDGTPARDPLMHEQIEPRSGTHPITNEPIGLPKSGSPGRINSINGHDWITETEVQYACIFDLTQPLSDAPRTDDLVGATRDCDAPCAEGDEECKAARVGCPCEKTDSGDYPQSPLCLTPNNTYGNIQYAAKAYPGIRELEVLKGHDGSASDNSIVASICPKNLNWGDRLSRGYGYNPAVQALVDRLKTRLSATCLPRRLTPEEGKLPCVVIETIPPSASEWANCADKGRDPVTKGLSAAVISSMKADGMCDAPDKPGCSEFSFCQLRQLTDDMHADKPLTKCQSEVGFEVNSPVPGFCYVDPEQGVGADAIVGACPANRRRLLRIVGDGDQKRAPAPESWTFIACAGAAYKADTSSNDADPSDQSKNK